MMGAGGFGLDFVAFVVVAGIAFTFFGQAILWLLMTVVRILIIAVGVVILVIQATLRVLLWLICLPARLLRGKSRVMDF